MRNAWRNKFVHVKCNRCEIQTDGKNSDKLRQKLYEIDAPVLNQTPAEIENKEMHVWKLEGEKHKDIRDNVCRWCSSKMVMVKTTKKI